MIFSVGGTYPLPGGGYISGSVSEPQQTSGSSGVILTAPTGTYYYPSTSQQLSSYLGLGILVLGVVLLVWVLSK